MDDPLQGWESSKYAYLWKVDGTNQTLVDTAYRFVTHPSRKDQIHPVLSRRIHELYGGMKRGRDGDEQYPDASGNVHETLQETDAGQQQPHPATHGNGNDDERMLEATTYGEEFDPGGDSGWKPDPEILASLMAETGAWEFGEFDFSDLVGDVQQPTILFPNLTVMFGDVIKQYNAYIASSMDKRTRLPDKVLETSRRTKGTDLDFNQMLDQDITHLFGNELTHAEILTHYNQRFPYYKDKNKEQQWNEVVDHFIKYQTLVKNSELCEEYIRKTTDAMKDLDNITRATDPNIVVSHLIGILTLLENFLYFLGMKDMSERDDDIEKKAITDYLELKEKLVRFIEERSVVLSPDEDKNFNKINRFSRGLSILQRKNITLTRYLESNKDRSDQPRKKRNKY